MIDIFVDKGRFDGGYLVNGRKAVIKVKNPKAALLRLFRRYIYILYYPKIIGAGKSMMI
ncbi:MAG: hypothetical protein PHD46_01315 [Eubacteriales bacterium]|jgi:hypothetical protein|nr:hypothetical protein [Eubacteriales bacterium]MDD4421654.1 hypothetical protein [Eubacteriales bacterium]